MDKETVRKELKDALGDGLIVNEEVLEQIVGGIQTGMNEKDLDLLMAKAGIQPGAAMKSLKGKLFIAKPKGGGL